MTALFNDLHDVAQVLAEHIREEVGIDDVQAGQPRDVGATTDGGRPHHASVRHAAAGAPQRPARDPAGRRAAASRRWRSSCFYLVTTSGADSDDPIAAHHALGRIMTLYHDQPSLQLPLSDNPGATAGAFSELGEGDAQRRPGADRRSTRSTRSGPSFDVPLQPWALFEVAPVQLVSQLDDLGPAPLVRPRRHRRSTSAPGPARSILRVAPEVVRPERARPDRRRWSPATLEAVVVGGDRRAAGDARR